MSQSGSSSYHHRDDLKCHSAGCRQGLIAWEWACETFIAKPAAGSRTVGATSRTETLQHRQTQQLGTQGTRHSKQTQMCAIRGNHLSCLSYHRGSGLSSDTRPCRANLSFTTAPKLHIGLNMSYTWGWLASTSVCLRIRPKSPRVDPRNCCIWCRASSKGLSRPNSMAAQQSMPSTDMATAQHKTASQVLLVKEEETKHQLATWWAGGQSPSHADRFTEGSHQRWEIEQLEAKPIDWQGLQEKLLVSENGSSLLDKTLKIGVNPGLMINVTQLGTCLPGTPHCTACCPSY